MNTMESTARQDKSFAEAYAQLNDAQRRAVDHIEGPVLVVAGPGTGKTQILAVRIGKILAETDAMPENILCLTYTDAGTVAMRKRLLDFIGADAHRVHIHTFHAFCNDVIQAHLDYFGKRELEPITDLENVMILESILEELPTGHLLKKLKGDLSYEVARLNNLFRMMKEEDWDEKRISDNIDVYLADLPNRTEYTYQRVNNKTGVKVGDPKVSKIAEEQERMEKLRAAAQLFPKYQARMKEAGRYDYSDMILWVVRAFRDPSAVGENMLRNYQERYLYILVDEFQDTNGAQNEILQLLISFWEVPNVFAVGDDDQSIYEFQGARVKNILDFYTAYQEHVEVIVLTDNYRSHQAVLNAARVVIEQNQERLINKIEGLTKQLTASHPSRQKIDEPKVIEYENPTQEHAGILREVETLLKQGVNPEEIAILYHRHKHADDLITACEKRGIPYQVRKKINILEVPIVQQMLTMLRYLNEEAQSAHSAEHLLFEIMHYPFIGIHPHDVAALSAWISSRRDPEITWRTVMADPSKLGQIRLRAHESITNLEKNITHWIQETFNLTLQMLFEKVLNESGLMQYILKNNDRVFLLEAISTLFKHIKAEGMNRPRITIRNYMEVLDQMETHGIQLSIEKTIAQKGGVQFITTHSSKGLEFEYVFLLGCNASNWEKSRGDNRMFAMPDTLTMSGEENKVESLRRLFYVAMTRAKQHLYISYAAASNEGKVLEASQFVSELLAGENISVEKCNIDAETMMAYQLTSLSPTKEVHIDLFDKDFIASKVEHFVMSASALNTYLDCPLRYYFERIIGVPGAKNDSIAFGNAVHYALRKLFERMRADERQQFPPESVFISDFMHEMERNEDAFTEKQFNNRMELGNTLLSDYYQTHIHQFNKVVVTEYPIRNAEMEGIPITGVFDKIEFIGKDVNVVDYKTGAVKYAREKLLPPSEKNPDGGDYWRQIMFYKILLDSQRTKPWKMISGEVDFIEKDESGEFVRHKFAIASDQVDIVKAQIRDTYARIKNLEFTTGCGDDDCDWCNFVRNLEQ